MREICCGDKTNHYAAEKPGYYHDTSMMADLTQRIEKGENITFYCSVCHAPLFTISSNGARTFLEFAEETEHHGWPSFRDGEIIWDNLGSYDMIRDRLTDM